MHVVRSSHLREKKIKAEDFPDSFKHGDKNCFDCKHFVVNFGKFKEACIHKNQKTVIGKERCQGRCKKNLLLVEDMRGPTYDGFIMEPIYAMYYQRLYLLNHGWRDKDWNFANACDQFDDMRDA